MSAFRTLTAFLIAPAPAVLFVGVVVAVMDGRPQATVAWTALTAVFGAYGPLLIFGLPVYVFGRQRGWWNSPYWCALAGALVATAPWLVMLFGFRTEYSSHNGVPTTVGDQLTNAGILSVLSVLSIVGALGGFSGVTFWLIRRPPCTHTVVDRT